MLKRQPSHSPAPEGRSPGSLLARCVLLFALALAGTGLTQAATLEGTATYR
ncbi:hypothetical protein JKG40_15070, partial [Acidithiobacillus sp. PG05]|nr:hypothetical protein [Acidithiobacillus sp. PG05]